MSMYHGSTVERKQFPLLRLKVLCRVAAFDPVEHDALSFVDIGESPIAPLGIDRCSTRVAVNTDHDDELAKCDRKAVFMTLPPFRSDEVGSSAQAILTLTTYRLALFVAGESIAAITSDEERDPLWVNDFVHVADICAAQLACIRPFSGVFNVHEFPSIARPHLPVPATMTPLAQRHAISELVFPQLLAVVVPLVMNL